MTRVTSNTMDWGNSNAKFQAWAGTFMDANIRANGGWTYVPQTGDIDPSTANIPSSGTFAGFRIYSSTVGSDTVYMRHDWGYNSTKGPLLKVQFGYNAPDGSGNLAAQKSTQVSFITGGGLASNPAGSTNMYMAQAAGRWSFVIGDPTQNAWHYEYSIHASVDGTGSMVSGMESYGCLGDGSTVFSEFVPTTGTLPGQFACWPIPFKNGSSSTSHTINGVIIVGHPVDYTYNQTNGSSPAVGVCGRTNFTIGTLVNNISVYSINRTYIPINVATVGAGQAGGPNTIAMILMD